MSSFAILAAILCLAVAAVLMRPLASAGQRAETRAAKDARLFRDQLDEVDRDLARGVINPDQAEGARAEISRRLLQATAEAETAPGYGSAPRGLSRIAAGLALIGAPAIATGLYLSLGAPGMPDQPLAARGGPAAANGAARPNQAEAEARARPQTETARADPAPETVPGARPGAGGDETAEIARLVTRLETTVASRPDDVEGRRLLANTYMQLERFAEAWPIYAEMIALMGEGAPADAYASQAEGMILAAEGYVSPEAERILAEALRRDASHQSARYYAGLALAQAGRLDEAIAIWERLAREIPPENPWSEWLGTMLARAYEMQGRPAGTTAGAAPSAEEVAAMLGELETRLLRDGGRPEDWAMLMNAYAGIGRGADAERIFEAAARALGPDGAARLAAMTGRGADGADSADPIPGPGAAEIEAARQMTPEARAAMIEEMVSGLEQRLTSAGGTPEEWLQLINAFVQLDRMEDARRAYGLGRQALGDGSAAAFLREQALLLGVIAQ